MWLASSYLGMTGTLEGAEQSSMSQERLLDFSLPLTSHKEAALTT